MIKLTPLASMTAQMDTISSTRRMPLGIRQNYIVSGGTVTGRLNGRVLAGGGDYLLVDAGGLGHIDARLTLELEDGAFVYVQYLGRVVMTDQVAEAFKTGGETQFGDTYFVTQIRFEAGHERYQWLNSVVAVGEGRVAPGRCIQYNWSLCESA